MKYKNVVKGIFLSRPNRFIAEVEIDGVKETVHVKNTGRCIELLVPGATVFLSVAENPERKTKYDLISVIKKTPNSDILINIDSSAPNSVAEEWLKKSGLFSENAVIRREVKYKNSRFDFYIEDGDKRNFLEVKGVTLENNGLAMFPDAPTERGVKHLNELCECVKDGFGAYALFVIQMKGPTAFKANSATHKEFAVALKNAEKSGVKLLAYDCLVTENEISVSEPVKILT